MLIYCNFYFERYWNVNSLECQYNGIYIKKTEINYLKSKSKHKIVEDKIPQIVKILKKIQLFSHLVQSESSIAAKYPH